MPRTGAREDGVRVGERREREVAKRLPVPPAAVRPPAVLVVVVVVVMVRLVGVAILVAVPTRGLLFPARRRSGGGGPRAAARPRAEQRRVGFFCQRLGACRRRTPRTRVDLRVPKDASRRELSSAALRSDPAPRRSPSACAEESPKKNRRTLATSRRRGRRSAPTSAASRSATAFRARPSGTASL